MRARLTGISNFPEPTCGLLRGRGAKVYDRCRVARQNRAEPSTNPFRLGEATPKRGFYARN